MTTSVASFLLATRRSREFGGVIGIIIIVLLTPVVFLLLTIDWGHDGLGVVSGFASWLGWTPLGAVWSVPGDAAQGHWGIALLKLLIAMATVGAALAGVDGPRREDAGHARSARRTPRSTAGSAGSRVSRAARPRRSPRAR